MQKGGESHGNTEGAQLKALERMASMPTRN
jgi:hypothetical protein